MTRSPRMQARKLIGGVRFADSAAGCASPDADAAVLVTEWPAVPGARLGQGRARRCAGNLVIDGRNALDREAMRAAGLLYEGIGRS